MNAESESTEGSEVRAFVVSRVFDAPCRRVFGAWTETGQLKRWWGPKGFTVRVCNLDLRPGGLLHYCLQTPDGSDMWGRFVFREIDSPARLVFINSFSDEKGGITRHPWNPDWPLEMLTTIAFAGKEGKTSLTVQWMPHSATDAERKAFDAGRDSTQQGWTGTLDQLADHLTNA